MVFQSDDKKRYRRTKRFILWMALLPTLLFVTQLVLSGQDAWQAFALRNHWLAHLGDASHLFSYYINLLEMMMWQHLTLAGFSLTALAGLGLFVWTILRLAAKRVQRSTIHLTDETLEVRHGINTVRIPWEHVDGARSRWLPLVGRHTHIDLAADAHVFRNRYVIPDVYEISSAKLSDQIGTRMY